MNTLKICQIMRVVHLTGKINMREYRVISYNLSETEKDKALLLCENL